MLKTRKKTSFLGKNLDLLLGQHNIDLKNLSMSTGVSVPTIIRMKRNDSNPTVSSLEPLLDFFRVDAESFLYEDMSTPGYQQKQRLGSLIPIPIYLLQEISSGELKAKVTHFIGAAGITSENIFGVRVNGDALTPAFQNNSIVLIDPDLEPREGDYVLCCLGEDKMIVFRQLFIDGKDCFFKPINPGFGGMKQHDNYKILGVIIKSIESYR
jgi:SOS-response transcriptional repressor LexA